MEAGYRRGLGSRIARGPAIMVPVLVTLLCVVATVMPYGSLQGIPLAPMFPLAAIYFFVLTRPTLMTPLGIFAIGLTQDLITGGPIGLWILVYEAAFVVTSMQRVFFVGRPAGEAWLGFIFVVSLSAAIIWSLASMFYQTAIPLVPIIGQMMVTALVYPLLAWVFTFVLPEREGGA